MLSKDQIVSSSDLRPELAETPEWGGEIYLRPMSSVERDAFEQERLASGNLRENFREKLLVRCLCDESGQRLFGDEDWNLLIGKSAIVIYRLAGRAMELSGLSKKN